MSTQKLRTPKGLGWLSKRAGTTDRNKILSFMIKLRQLNCAIWTECIWLIADASQSNTKFIISDHPVTVYNRRCGPRSQWCRDFEDPDISFHGTHTIFPLSLDKILILTNLSSSTKAMSFPSTRMHAAGLYDAWWVIPRMFISYYPLLSFRF